MSEGLNPHQNYTDCMYDEYNYSIGCLKSKQIDNWLFSSSGSKAFKNQ